MSSNGITTDLEKQSLEAHVDLCAMRYKSMDDRLMRLEAKVIKLHDEIVDGRSGLSKVMITTAGTIVAAIMSAVITIIIKF